MMRCIGNKLVILLNLIVWCTFQTNAQARRQADKDTDTWRYEIEAVQTGVQGTYLIKVWSYSKVPEIAVEQAKKNAVHGIIFRGFAGKDRVSGQPPLAPEGSIDQTKLDYLNSFFRDNGDYMKFVSLTNDGAVAAEDRMKIGKEYKIGVVVSVRISELRKNLENAGIVKRLDAGF